MEQWKRASFRVDAGTSGFIYISDSDRTVPAELGKESQAFSCLEERNSACRSSSSRDDRTLVDLYVELAGFSNDAGGCQTPSCCAFTHRVAFEEGSGPRVHLKSGPGNRGRSACGTTHVARLEFPRRQILNHWTTRETQI